MRIFATLQEIYTVLRQYFFLYVNVCIHACMCVQYNKYYNNIIIIVYSMYGCTHGCR